MAASSFIWSLILGWQPWTKRDTRRVFSFAEPRHVTAFGYHRRQREHGLSSLADSHLQNDGMVIDGKR